MTTESVAMDSVSSNHSAGMYGEYFEESKAVTEEGVVVNGQTIPADSVVLAVGFRPRTSLAQGLYGSGMEIYQVGDGARVGSVMTAVADGYTIGRKI